MSEAQVYTVRVWRQLDAFRASVRAVGDEQATLFTAPAQLARFLEQACAPPAAAPAAPAPRPTPSKGSTP